MTREMRPSLREIVERSPELRGFLDRAEELRSRREAYLTTNEQLLPDESISYLWERDIPWGNVLLRVWEEMPDLDELKRWNQESEAPPNFAETEVRKRIVPLIIEYLTGKAPSRNLEDDFRKLPTSRQINYYQAAENLYRELGMLYVMDKP